MRREVACARASLSVQDLLRVGGASGREGLQRTRPRREKLVRPRRAASVVGVGGGGFDVDVDADGEVTVAGAVVQGVASS